jgi:reactive intermediate/imine deaminase
MSVKRIMETEKVGGTDGTWAQATRRGNMVFVSGQVGLDAGGVLGPDFASQARQALENLVNMLEAAGATLEDLASITVFVTDMKNRPTFAVIRREYFEKNPPASTIVEISQLYAPEVLVEINGIAVTEA